jgi:hypothetical protein
MNVCVERVSLHGLAYLRQASVGTIMVITQITDQEALQQNSGTTVEYVFRAR